MPGRGGAALPEGEGVDPKKTIKECAKELGASEKTLDDWVVRYEATGKVGRGRTEGQRALDEANRRIVIEAQAHRFASALLMPEQEFVDSLYTVSLEGYRELKPYWKTSIAAMVRRTKDLGIITEDGYRNLYISISRRKWRKVEPFDEEIAPERPALAKKCLDVIAGSMVGSEDEFIKMTALPDDFIMTIFGGYRRVPRSGQGQVIQLSMRSRK